MDTSLTDRSTGGLLNRSWCCSSCHNCKLISDMELELDVLPLNGAACPLLPGLVVVEYA